MPHAPDPIPASILVIRGHRVVIDADLARLYGVPTKVFNQAFKRNAHRFPEDFAFRLTAEETAGLRSHSVTSDRDANSSQIVKSSAQPVGKPHDAGNWSQSVTSSKAKHRGAAYRPWAFTEHGALMAANILRSERATEMGIYVVRAFVKQREALAANGAILKRLAEIDRTLLEHDEALKILWHRLRPLLAPPPEKPKRKIGFHEGNR